MVQKLFMKCCHTLFKPIRSYSQEESLPAHLENPMIHAKTSNINRIRKKIQCLLKVRIMAIA